MIAFRNEEMAPPQKMFSHQPIDDLLHCVREQYDQLVRDANSKIEAPHPAEPQLSSTVLVFVPSLSWQMIVICKKREQKKPFPHHSKSKSYHKHLPGAKKPMVLSR